MKFTVNHNPTGETVTTTVEAETATIDSSRNILQFKDADDMQVAAFTNWQSYYPEETE